MISHPQLPSRQCSGQICHSGSPWRWVSWLYTTRIRAARAKYNRRLITGTVDLNEYLRRIAAYAHDHPDEEWIVGGGWSMESFEGGVPTRDILDRVVPDRPVYLINRDHHAAWVNGRALDLASITADTPDPANGRIDRRPDGEPIGALQEGAMDLVMDGTGFGLGLRSKRYAAVIEDGVITQLNVEETGGISVSSCESVLAGL